MLRRDSSSLIPREIVRFFGEALLSSVTECILAGESQWQNGWLEQLYTPPPCSGHVLAAPEETQLHPGHRPPMDCSPPFPLEEGQSGSDEPNLLLPPASETPTDAGLSLLDEDAGAHECSACVWREQSKVLRLETIKSQILSKLRLKQAPNISREVVNQLLPKAPPLQQLLDHHDFQGDASSQDEFME
ncbi:hypothetical protein INR49_009344, partial [Caranx melampygus]